MKGRKFEQSGKRGSILALMLIVTVMFLLTGVGMLRLGLQARVYAARRSDEIAAQVAADAGLTAAVSEMSAKLAALSTEDRAATAGPGEVNPTLSKLTDTPLANSNTTYSYKVVANSVLSRNDFTITCVGKCGRVEKTVSAQVTRSGGPFKYAIFTESGMTLKPNTVIDGYNSSDGAYDPSTALRANIGANSTESASITIGGGAIVNGDVVVGPGGDPDSVISAGRATITGQTTALSEENELPSVTVPFWLDQMVVRPSIQRPTVLTGSGKYSSINLGRRQSITVNGASTIYVIGDISLMNSAQVQISSLNPKASLTLYLGGNLYCKNGGMINNLTQDPKKLRIYALDSCTNMSFATAGVFYGAIYAPNSPIYLKSGLEIYGSVIAGDFVQGATSNFHYDVSLKDADADVGVTQFRIARWWE